MREAYIEFIILPRIGRFYFNVALCNYAIHEAYGKFFIRRCACVCCSIFYDEDAEPVLEFVKFISLHEKSIRETFWKCWQMAFGSKLFALFVVVYICFFLCCQPFLSASLFATIMKMSALSWHFTHFTSDMFNNTSICLSCRCFFFWPFLLEAFALPFSFQCFILHIYTHVQNFPLRYFMKNDFMPMHYVFILLTEIYQTPFDVAAWRT